MRCELSRQNGFDDAVQVAFADLPTGVFAEPLVFSLANPLQRSSYPFRIEGCASGYVPTQAQGYGDN